MKQLLALKAEYKQKTGQDYKPGAAPAVAPTAAPAPTQAAAPSPGQPSSPQAQSLFSQVAQQGELVRKLKSEKAPKASEASPGLRKLPAGFRAAGGVGRGPARDVGM